MGTLREKKELRNKNRLFEDRFAAGDFLAEMMIWDDQEFQDGFVLAVPSGGVPVGKRISLRFDLPFDLIIVRKIQIPGNTEAGFGAMTQQGEVFFNQELIDHLQLGKDQINRQMDKVRQELETRSRIFRKNKPFPDLSAKTVILTDDGLASGYTMQAAIENIKKRDPKKIIVAVPTAPRRTLDRILPLVDIIYSPHIQETGPFAVANAYKNWYDLDQEEVLQVMEK